MLPSRLYSSIELRGKRKKKRVGARDHLGTRREGSASASIPNFHRQYSIRTSYLPFPSGLRTQASRLGEKFASEKIVLEIPKHVALDHPRTFRCPYITRSTSLRCVRLSLETTRAARGVPNSSCRMDTDRVRQVRLTRLSSFCSVESKSWSRTRRIYRAQ